MNRRQGLAAAMVLLLSVSVGGGIGAHAADGGIKTRIAVPIFTSSETQWLRVIGASSAVGIIVLNPLNGPGISKDQATASLAREAQAKGIMVLGYVPTSWDDGKVPVAKAEGWIGDYYGWYGVDGIFLDQVNATCHAAPVTYYTALYQNIKNRPGTDLVALNPGTLTGECYAPISDIITTFEDSITKYYDANPAGWTTRYPVTHFMNVISNVPSSSEMRTMADLAHTRRASWIYVTDQGGNTSNPYGSLPSYFDQEVQYVESLPPFPSSTAPTQDQGPYPTVFLIVLLVAIASACTVTLSSRKR